MAEQGMTGAEALALCRRIWADGYTVVTEQSRRTPEGARNILFVDIDNDRVPIQSEADYERLRRPKPEQLRLF